LIAGMSKGYSSKDTLLDLVPNTVFSILEVCKP
jgi:hypothetical protein